jgi:hypothetical protein
MGLIPYSTVQPTQLHLDSFSTILERTLVVRSPPGPQLGVRLYGSEQTVQVPHGRGPCVFLIFLFGSIRRQTTCIKEGGRRHSRATHEMMTICF